MKNLRDDAIAIWKAGLAAVQPENLFHNAMHLTSNAIEIEDISIPLPRIKRLVVIGAGKASASMAVAFQKRLPEAWLKSGRVTGWINVPAGTIPTGYTSPVHLHEGRPAALNEPTEQGVYGSQQILSLVQNCSADDVVVCLLSGGASALLPLPIPEITLKEKRDVTRYLSAAGATIEELNTVRIALSQIKGGGLARACRAGRFVTLVISDVLGDDLRYIGSGPTFFSTPPYPTAYDVLKKYTTKASDISANIWDAAQRAGSQTMAAPTCEVEHLILANNATAVDAAGVEAVSRGYRYLMNCARQSEGDAEELGRVTLEHCLPWVGDEAAPDCFISGGEPTVKLVAPELRGKGGRNQQLVLAALQRRMEMSREERDLRPLCFLSGGTDGEDGPTDVAGAWFDSALEKVVELDHAPLEGYLSRNDAYHFFDQYGGHLRTGPTGTNVCDLRVVVW
jgi:hydroxypyruvate reductase